MDRASVSAGSPLSRDQSHGWMQGRSHRLPQPRGSCLARGPGCGELHTEARVMDGTPDAPLPAGACPTSTAHPRPLTVPKLASVRPLPHAGPTQQEWRTYPMDTLPTQDSQCWGHTAGPSGSPVVPLSSVFSRPLLGLPTHSGMGSMVPSASNAALQFLVPQHSIPYVATTSLSTMAMPMGPEEPGKVGGAGIPPVLALHWHQLPCSARPPL